jgi:Uncharacterized protein conserved in bacteria
MQEVLAFVGPSGSGKSYHAIELASELNVDLIIDDGLLITVNGRIIGGISAKLQPTKVGAIKTALFTETFHCKEALKILQDSQPNTLLILGTSNKMVEKIADRLNLPPIRKIINITEVVDNNQIRIAKYHRKQLGKHVIPAPAIEVSKTFPNTLLESIQTFLKINKVTKTKTKMLEQTIIRPHFSYLGRIIITEKAIEDLIRGILKTNSKIHKINSIKIKCENGNAIIAVHLDTFYGVGIKRFAEVIQKDLKRDIEKYTEFNVININVVVDNLVFGHTLIRTGRNK